MTHSDALVIALIAVAVFAVLFIVGPAIGNVFSQIVEVIDGASGPITSIATDKLLWGVRVTIVVAEDKVTLTTKLLEGTGLVWPDTKVCNTTDSCTVAIIFASGSGVVEVSSGAHSKTATW